MNKLFKTFAIIGMTLGAVFGANAVSYAVAQTHWTGSEFVTANGKVGVISSIVASATVEPVAPGLVGSPLSKKHQDAAAYRNTGKEILRDIWIKSL